ncbi:MAG: histone deacetylase [Actinobacteria bacterium]|nr:histone deacetylase [Actinomycetota bacterium]
MSDVGGTQKTRPDPKLLIVYHDLFSERGYPPLKDRVEPAFRHLKEMGYLDRQGVEVLKPGPAPLELLGRVHTPLHIADVETSGLFETAALSTGGVVEASLKLVSGEAENAFCFVGAAGHHASREGYWGFCFINDVAVAATYLLDEGLAGRLAIIDIDPHFGDGTRDILGPEKRVLHINLHSSYGSRGGGAGATNIDVPLEFDTGDDVFMTHVEAGLDRALEFEPDLLYVIFGDDSHREDYGAFRLSVDAYRRFAVATGERFPSGVCYVLSGGSGVEVGREVIGRVVDVLSG